LGNDIKLLRTNNIKDNTMKKLFMLLVLVSSFAFAQVGTLPSETKSVTSKVVATAAGGFWARYVLPTGTKDLLLRNMNTDTAKVAFKAADTVTEGAYQYLMLMADTTSVDYIKIERFRYDTLWYKATSPTSIMIHSFSR